MIKTVKGDIQNTNNIVIENIPFPIWIKGLDGNFIAMNKKFRDICKLDRDCKLILEDNICSHCKSSNICEEMFDFTIKTRESKVFEIYIGDRLNECHVNPYLNEDGKIIGVIGTLIDTTESKKKQDKFKEGENVLRTIIDTLPQYIFYKDIEGRYIGYNKKWKDYYDKLGIESMIGKNDLETGTVPQDVAKIFMEQDKSIMESRELKIIEREIKNPNGETRIEETIKVPVVDEYGQVWGIVGIASDITERIELKEKLMRLSYIDSLTGVYNRACFEEKKEELNKSENLPIGVIMGDVNGLKVINDTFGHLEGDRLLKEMTDILRNVIRDEDFIFRWGGDEFVILMPNCDEKKCEHTIAKITKECKRCEFNLIDMSISLGSSIKNCLEEDIYVNLQEAEEKLYRQKFLSDKSVTSSIIFSLNQSLQDKNVETQNHTQRLVNYAIKVGKRLGFTTAQLDELELVAKLHDIGKIGINEDILLKSGKLSSDEFEIIKLHAEKGYRILQTSSELSHVARGILTHHERYDGKGYPLGLKGDEIPITARIVNLVDSYDAMTSDKVYKKVKTKEEAIEELKACKGTQFDPHITDIFIGILREER